MEKWGLGIRWGLWYKKIAKAPEYSIHQSPQPNPHIFFTLKNCRGKIDEANYTKR